MTKARAVHFRFSRTAPKRIYFRSLGPQDATKTRQYASGGLQEASQEHQSTRQKRQRIRQECQITRQERQRTRQKAQNDGVLSLAGRLFEAKAPAAKPLAANAKGKGKAKAKAKAKHVGSLCTIAVTEVISRLMTEVEGNE